MLLTIFVQYIVFRVFLILQLDPGGGANWKVEDLGTTRILEETAPKSELQLRSYGQLKLKKNPRKKRKNL